MKTKSDTLNNEQGRRRAIDVAINLSWGTALAPKEYERFLLEQFVRGILSLDQVLVHLEIQGFG